MSEEEKPETSEDEDGQESPLDHPVGIIAKFASWVRKSILRRVEDGYGDD